MNENKPPHMRKLFGAFAPGPTGDRVPALLLATSGALMAFRAGALAQFAD